MSEVDPQTFIPPQNDPLYPVTFIAPQRATGIQATQGPPGKSRRRIEVVTVATLDHLTTMSFWFGVSVGAVITAPIIYRLTKK